MHRTCLPWRALNPLLLRFFSLSLIRILFSTTDQQNEGDQFFTGTAPPGNQNMTEFHWDSWSKKDKNKSAAAEAAAAAASEEDVFEPPAPPMSADSGFASAPHTIDTSPKREWPPLARLLACLHEHYCAWQFAVLLFGTFYN